MGFARAAASFAKSMTDIAVLAVTGTHPACFALSISTAHFGFAFHCGPMRLPSDTCTLQSSASLSIAGRLWGTSAIASLSFAMGGSPGTHPVSFASLSVSTAHFGFAFHSGPMRLPSDTCALQSSASVSNAGRLWGTAVASLSFAVGGCLKCLGGGIFGGHMACAHFARAAISSQYASDILNLRSHHASCSEQNV